MMVEQAKAWAQEVIGPQFYEAASWVYWSLVKPIFAEPRLHWLFFVSAIAIALVFYLSRPTNARSTRGFLSYLFPKNIYSHRSAILDFKFYVVFQLLAAHARFGALVVGLVGLLHIGDGVTLAMNTLFGNGPGWAEPSPVALAGFTLAVLMASDLGKFIAHYALHKVPVFWEFHKVHHAAEVLMPFTSFRAHPVETMLDFFFRLTCTAVVAGIYSWFYPTGIAEATILTFNAVAFLIFLPITHLQHSHVALGYGQKFSHLLVSPLMHQVHHSCESRHLDKNLGFVFPFWDWIAGTLYVPKSDEQFRLGLADGNERLDSVWRLFVQPIVAACRLLVRGRPVQSGTQ